MPRIALILRPPARCFLAGFTKIYGFFPESSENRSFSLMQRETKPIPPHMKTQTIGIENCRTENWSDLSLDLFLDASMGGLDNGFIDCADGWPGDDEVIEDMIFEGRATKGCLPGLFPSEFSCVELPSNVLPFRAASEQGRLLA